MLSLVANQPTAVAGNRMIDEAKIGGITPENCVPLVAAGADFLAVSHAVWGGDEAAAIKAFARAIQSGSDVRRAAGA